MTAPSSSEIDIFSRRDIRSNRNRSAATLADHAFLHDWAMDQLLDRLKDIRRAFPVALQIGTRAKAVPEGTSGIKTFIQMDMAEKLLQAGKLCVQGDEEFLPFADGSLDLVIIPPGLHMINDLPGALIQIRRALKPDGLLLAAFFGGETLNELRACLTQAELKIKGGASPRIAPFATMQQMGALMQRSGLALPVVDYEKITVTYPDMFKLMRDLRFMGESNSQIQRSKTPPGKALFDRAAEIYARSFCDRDGKIRATFEIIFLTGWAPHETQQKALQPGSARHSLADALGAKEIKAGEKANPL